MRNTRAPRNTYSQSTAASTSSRSTYDGTHIDSGLETRYAEGLEVVEPRSQHNNMDEPYFSPRMNEKYQMPPLSDPVRPVRAAVISPQAAFGNATPISQAPSYNAAVYNNKGHGTGFDHSYHTEYYKSNDPARIASPASLTSASVDYSNRGKMGGGPDRATMSSSVTLPFSSHGGNQKNSQRSRRKLWIIICVLVVVLVAGAVGGAVGGVMSSKNSSNNNTNGAAANPSPDPSPVPENQQNQDDDTDEADYRANTGTVLDSERALAVVTSTDSDKADMHCVYQNLGSTELLYRVGWDNSTKPEKRIPLRIKPRRGTPIAATSTTGRNPVEINVFYTSQQKGKVAIVRASMSCTEGQETCSMTTNAIISNDVPLEIANNTGLAAYTPDGGDQLRVYYHNKDHVVWLLSNKDAEVAEPVEKGWAAAYVAPEAVDGSKLAVQKYQTGAINVVFVPKTTQKLGYLEYKDEYGPSEGRLYTINEETKIEWLPSNFITATYMPVEKLNRIYFPAPTNGYIISYRTTPTTGYFSGDNAAWGRADGGIASVSWENNTRIIYFDKNHLTMNEFLDGSWSKTILL